MFTGPDLHLMLQCVSIAREVDMVSPGLFRVGTSFKYPDGSFIDVFVDHESGLPGIAEVKVTDLGETFAWLLNVAIRPWRTARRRRLVQDALHTLGVIHKEGELFIRISRHDELQGAVIRLLQAQIRVSDLLFTQRLGRPTEFQEVFNEFLEEREVIYQEQVTIVTPRRPVIVDYVIHGHRIESLVQLFSTRNPHSAHNTANEVFARWYDLQGVREEAQRVTVLDDAVSVFREPDLERISDLSHVLPWSDQPTVVDLLSLGSD